MIENIKQSEASVSANHSKITVSKPNVKVFELRPPFGIDDQSQNLATFKASRLNPTVAGRPKLAFRKLRPISREYEVNPNMKTMYQYQFNDTADVKLGYCANKSVESLNEQFKRTQQRSKIAVELFKLSLPEAPPRKYRSDYSRRITEYAAEISYVGSKFILNNIHDHSKCGRVPKNCIHYIEF